MTSNMRRNKGTNETFSIGYLLLFLCLSYMCVDNDMGLLVSAMQRTERPSYKNNAHIDTIPLVNSLIIESLKNPVRSIPFTSRKTQQLLDKRNSKSQNLRIHFDTTHIEQEIALSANQTIKDFGTSLIDTVLPTIADQFSKAISINQNPGLYIARSICSSLFQDIIPSDYILEDVDLIIFVGSFDIWQDLQFCQTNSSLNILASAFPCDFNVNNRPIAGFINMCLDALQKYSTERVIEILSHEILHILVLHPNLFKLFVNAVDYTPLTPRNPSPEDPFNTKLYKCVNGADDAELYEICENTIAYNEEEVVFQDVVEQRGYYEIVLPTVRNVVRNHFNCQSLSGARLENQPTSEVDCTGSHFDERYFHSDLMSAVFQFDSAHFSPLVLALLEDSGWYKSNFTNAENSAFGLNAGCGFATEDCIVDGQIPDYSEGYFCNTLESDNMMSCGPSLDFRGVCDLIELDEDPGRTYFENWNYGPDAFIYADFCPTVRMNRTYCDSLSSLKIDAIEMFGSSSSCMDVSIDSGPQTALCIQSSCDYDNEQFSFTVGATSYNCSLGDAGEVIEVVIDPVKKYEFTCPKLTQACPDMFCPSMCSGKGICDWDAVPKPICNCFDSNDNTPGCYESQVNAPTKCQDVTNTDDNNDSVLNTTDDTTDDRNQSQNVNESDNQDPHNNDPNSSAKLTNLSFVCIYLFAILSLISVIHF
mmetsp:Transcript_2411/g.3206  ORF Transcript_2411/g.3206 Transcript_2411/m.3206 type:complete len:703 (+) Transcript_2411:88-2196(+)